MRSLIGWIALGRPESLLLRVFCSVRLTANHLSYIEHMLRATSMAMHNINMHCLQLWWHCDRQSVNLINDVNPLLLRTSFFAPRRGKSTMLRATRLGWASLSKFWASDLVKAEYYNIWKTATCQKFIAACAHAAILVHGLANDFTPALRACHFVFISMLEEQQITPNCDILTSGKMTRMMLWG